MTDALQMLEEDHREVEQLFDQYRSSKDESLIEKICDELTVHTLIEQQVVYPVLGSKVPAGEGMESHAEEEHEKVTELIVEVERRGHQDPSVEGLMEQIIDAVGHHVEEEEGEVFPKMREALDPDALSKLGERLADAKRDVEARVEKSGPLVELPKDKLYEMAQAKGISGRSDMTKEELLTALRAP